MRHISLVMLWILITSTGPFLFNMIEWHPHKLIILPLLAVMVMILIHKREIIIGDRNIIIILAVQLIFFSILSTVYYTDPWYSTNVFLIIGIVIIYIYIHSVIGVDRTIRSILLVMSGIGILGVIGFVIAIAGIMEPSILYYRTDTQPVYSYIVTFTNTIFPIGNGQLIRVGGFFNEGGTLGFYLIHALILNKLAYDNKRFEIVLILSGLLAFSFAFYLSLMLYFAFFYLKRRAVIYLAGISLITLAGLVMITLYRSDSAVADYVYDLVFRRFELSDEGNILKGNNRIAFIVEAIRPFLERPLLGYGADYVEKEMPVSIATFMGPLLMFGIIGSVIYFLHVIYLCIMAIPIRPRSNNTVLMKASAILLLNYLQRPFVSSLFSYIILILLAEVYSRQSYRRSEKPQMGYSHVDAVYNS